MIEWEEREMSLVEGFIQRAKETSARVVLPEGDDERIVQAGCRLATEGIASPILLGKSDEVGKLAGGEIPDGVVVVDPASSSEVGRYCEAYAARREGITVRTAARLLKRPLMYGAMMVAEGDADAMVAGVTKATSQVISAGALAIGYAEGVSQPSSFFLMAFEGPPEHVLVYADAAVAVDPTAEELAQIAVVTAGNAQQLLDVEPKVAMLSFSTYGSAVHDRVTKVQEATRIAREIAPDLAIDGELQADSALSASVAAKKCPDSTVAGHANVLVFPDLDSGNIAYKLTQYLAGAQAVGPIMQGFRRPINDLSRGASVDDIVAVCAISALQSAG
jgi:phosphate acetyltransferase